MAEPVSASRFGFVVPLLVPGTATVAVVTSYAMIGHSDIIEGVWIVDLDVN